jgi:hypothetical protein
LSFIGNSPINRLYSVLDAYHRLSQIIRMLSPNHTPSLVPDFDVTVHIVLDDFGRLGHAYRETDETMASREDVIDDLLSGQFNNPLRVIAFNTAEGWSRDVSEDIAWELMRRVTADQKPLTAPTRAFVEFHIGEDELLHAEAGLL